jgi:hypothetical protein
MGSGYRESCRGLFKELKILTLASQYIFSLLLFVVLMGVTLPQIVFIITLTPDIKQSAFASCIPDYISEGSFLLWY